MLTTAGDTTFAMSRKVVAVSGPAMGALFIGGATPCAAEEGDRPSREAITMPTAREAIATSSA